MIRQDKILLKPEDDLTAQKKLALDVMNGKASELFFWRWMMSNVSLDTALNHPEDLVPATPDNLSKFLQHMGYDILSSEVPEFLDMMKREKTFAFLHYFDKRDFGMKKKSSDPEEKAVVISAILDRTIPDWGYQNWKNSNVSAKDFIAAEQKKKKPPPKNINVGIRPVAKEVLDDMVMRPLKKGGDITTIHYDKDTMYIGNVSDAFVPSGEGSMYMKGGRYVGDFLNGSYWGIGTFYYSDGSMYSGNWVRGKKQGHGIYYTTKGEIIDAEWSNDNPITKTVQRDERTMERLEKEANERHKASEEVIIEHIHDTGWMDKLNKATRKMLETVFEQNPKVNLSVDEKDKNREPEIIINNFEMEGQINVDAEEGNREGLRREYVYDMKEFEPKTIKDMAILGRKRRRRIKAFEKDMEFARPREEYDTKRDKELINMNRLAEKFETMAADYKIAKWKKEVENKDEFLRKASETNDDYEFYKRFFGGREAEKNMTTLKKFATNKNFRLVQRLKFPDSQFFSNDVNYLTALLHIDVAERVPDDYLIGFSDDGILFGTKEQQANSEYPNGGRLFYFPPNNPISCLNVDSAVAYAPINDLTFQYMRTCSCDYSSDTYGTPRQLAINPSDDVVVLVTFFRNGVRFCALKLADGRIYYFKYDDRNTYITFDDRWKLTQAGFNLGPAKGIDKVASKADFSAGIYTDAKEEDLVRVSKNEDTTIRNAIRIKCKSSSVLQSDIRFPRKIALDVILYCDLPYSNFIDLVRVNGTQKLKPSFSLFHLFGGEQMLNFSTIMDLPLLAFLLGEKFTDNQDVGKYIYQLYMLRPDIALMKKFYNKAKMLFERTLKFKPDKIPMRKAVSICELAAEVSEYCRLITDGVISNDDRGKIEEIFRFFNEPNTYMLAFLSQDFVKFRGICLSLAGTFLYGSRKPQKDRIANGSEIFADFSTMAFKMIPGHIKTPFPEANIVNLDIIVKEAIAKRDFSYNLVKDPRELSDEDFQTILTYIQNEITTITKELTRTVNRKKNLLAERDKHSPSSFNEMKTQLDAQIDALSTKLALAEEDNETVERHRAANQEMGGETTDDLISSLSFVSQNIVNTLDFQKKLRVKVSKKKKKRGGMGSELSSLSTGLTEDEI